MTENNRFSWEYSNYDSTGEIYDWKRKECLITDYLQKYEIEEWCQELNKIVNENEQLKKENRKLKNEINLLKLNFGYSYDGVGCKRIIDLLNEFNDENQRITSLLQSERRELIEQNNNYRKLLNELAEEKEDWKNNCLQSVNENSILWNEIFILMEQGAEPSNAFKNYLNGLKNKNKKLEGDLE